MKKDGQFWLNVAMLIVLGILLVQNHQLKQQMEHLNQQWISTANSLQRQVSDIPRTVRGELEEQASLWRSCEVTSGEPDRTTWLVPVTIEVTPKEVRANTTAIVQLDNTQTEMTWDGAHFTALLQVPIFGGGEGVIILSDGIEQRLDVVGIYPDQDQYLLTDLHAYMGGGYTTQGETRSYDGTVDVYIPQRTENDIQLVGGEVLLMVDEQVVERQSIDLTEHRQAEDLLSVPCQWQTKVQSGQRIELWCYLVDNHDLTYKILVDGQIIAQNGQNGKHYAWIGDVIEIIDKQGETLYLVE